MFKREDCEYKKFNVENHKIEFDSNKYHTLISIPFSEYTQKSIKEKLNNIIFQEMNEYIKTVEYMPMPCGLLLDAKMQIESYNGNDLNPSYYISIEISDLISEIGYGVRINKVTNIDTESSKFRTEFMSYCRYRLDKLLFPV